ncbi:MAG: HAD hydrolase-like protein, partial [Firmicutes bacterium]|nr:HAD hydrolase-like protein [Bacillota bacterium]
DLTLTYRKLERACTFIRRGAGFIATHPDFNCPTEEGFIPDAGAMIAFIRAATGVEPKVIGKPRPEMIAAAAAKTGVPAAAMAMIGDRLYTDVAMGKEAGVKTILVLTGETKKEDLATSPFRPDLVAASLREVVGWLEEMERA